MADVAVNAAAVQLVTQTYQRVSSGAAINCGMGVTQYNDNLWYPGNASSGTNAVAAGNNAMAIAVGATNGPNQPFDIATGAFQVNYGNGTFTAGQQYGLSINGAGLLAPIADQGTNSWANYVGWAVDTAILEAPPGGAFSTGQRHV